MVEKKNLFEEVVGYRKEAVDIWDEIGEDAVRYADEDMNDVLQEYLAQIRQSMKKDKTRLKWNPEIYEYEEIVPTPVKKNLYDEIVKVDKDSVMDFTDAEEFLYFHGKAEVEAHTNFGEKPTAYLFDEERYIMEALAHIKSTYTSHYAGGTQPTELIIDSGNGVGFTVGNIIKYAARLGKKDGWNRKDVYKIIHYATMLLYIIERDGLVE